jgi:hypothetical protein
MAKTIKVDELLGQIFGDEPQPLAAQFGAWVQSSRRFRAFAEQYRDKLRKKVRGADAEMLEDLRFEVETAYLLLQERRFALLYEPYGVGKLRAPDFALIFNDHLQLMVEVKRMRPSPLDTATRFADSVCAKLGQLPAGSINILVLGGDPTAPRPDISAAMAALQLRAERKENDFYARRGLRDATDFVNRSRLLSAILFRQPPGPLLLWTNPQARQTLPTQIRTILQRLEAPSS